MYNIVFACVKKYFHIKDNDYIRYNQKYCGNFLFFNRYFKKCTLRRSIRSLNDTISVILLLELLGCCSRLGLSMFVVLTVSWLFVLRGSTILWAKNIAKF